MLVLTVLSVVLLGACRFHGIYPSKKSKEKIMRQVANEMAAKKNSGSVMADNTMMKHKLSKQVRFLGSRVWGS